MENQDHPIDRRAQKRMVQHTIDSFVCQSDRSPPKKSKYNEEGLVSYRSRVRTYLTGNWHSAKELNPRHLSERGWRLLSGSKSTLVCNSCDNYLDCTLPPLATTPIKVYNRCLRKVYELVESAHELTCPAKSFRPVYHTDIISNDAIRRRILQRFDSMTSILEVQKLQEFESDDITDGDIKSIFGDSEKQKSLKILSIMGFQGAESTNDRIHCDLCVRSVSISGTLDANRLHYWWCPMMDEREPERLPHWKAMLRRTTISTLTLAQKLARARSVLASGTFIDDLACRQAPSPVEPV